jgi:hypothetical protein
MKFARKDIIIKRIIIKMNQFGESEMAREGADL